MTVPEQVDGVCGNSTTWEDQPGYSGGVVTPGGTYRTWTCGLPRGHKTECRDGDHYWWWSA